jgi:hypothetical protein
MEKFVGRSFKIDFQSILKDQKNQNQRKIRALTCLAAIK